MFGQAGDHFGGAAWHEEFLERARFERERNDDAASRGALAAYLVARVIDRALEGTSTEDDRQAYNWQLESARRYIGELDVGRPEVRHLDGILDALRVVGNAHSPAVRMALTAFAYFLEHEGRLAEALDILSLAARTHGSAIPPADFPAIALFAGRLNRLQARFEAATEAYAAAEEGARAIGDVNARLVSRLGRAHVMRAQGNLPLARAAVEEVIAEARAEGLTDTLSRAHADLGHVMTVQGDRLGALRATYEAFKLAGDPLNRMRYLGDLGVELSDLGYYDVARIAFSIVVSSNTSFIVKTNARLELMEIESACCNRVAFERHRGELRDVASRMTPSMAIDYRFKAGTGLARFGQFARAREAWAEGMRLAEAHHLNEWYFRLERLSQKLDGCAAAPQSSGAERQTPPAAIADLAAGLTAYAEEAMPA